MKKYYLNWSGLILSASLVLSSCMNEIEAPVATEVAKAIETVGESSSGGENLRKGPNGVFYQEKVTNQSILVDNPAAFPGFGEGQSTYMGKGFSFFNQYALGVPDDEGVVFTVAAPVTEFFKEEIEALGLDTDVIDSNFKVVSSITTDGKGNSIWFSNITNRAQFDEVGNITFEADIEIVGGTGKFEGATGAGTVIGNVQADGKGTTLVRANIVF